ncbi:uncharacterized protein EV420DRAFT_1642593 [Desarmillaria tabescens]|uniref:Heterokaryon incompatibility domain-containing protein n=1 Tax=Armillaria tabescens TaxID=1929756 RepID=A0AA39KD10_ARMTA|nr:uncharacterized protein EV420DRAFT_1642593 [Desarmillaria tabescens]KAK0458875.1 hypothetical protein EV420DRAFT_1642593 [Desarmillaria tabescens]
MVLLLFVGVMLWKHIRSVFLTSRTKEDLSPDETPELDESPNTTASSRLQEKHGNSTSEDAGPALEATPDLSPRLRPESPSIAVGLQTNVTEEQPSEDEASDTSSEPDDDEPWPPKDTILPEVTISAFTETGQAESSIVVPLQRAYTGRKPVISSRLADTPCAALGIQGILDLLNTTLGTSHSLNTQSLSFLLEECIANKYDFGMAYGRIRRIWYTSDWSTIQDTLRKWEEKDREMRQKALDGNRIVEPLLPPRRVWDLYSNRVVPVVEKHRADMRTPINGYEWPVPIPKDTNLNPIRIEMLGLGAEYAWLDVLCLRQAGRPGEDMRTEEWKLDVPTIGAMYADSRDVVTYLSGLGRPFSLKDGDLESDRCWFRRAWTLQEVGRRRVIAGDTPDGPMHAECKDGKYKTELLTRFHEQLESMQAIPHSVFAGLRSMRNRVSTNPVDKIAGLAFLLPTNSIPAYYERVSLEDAWTALVNSMRAEVRGILFSLYPEPGNAGRKWIPSWNQLRTKPLPTEGYSRIEIDRDEVMKETEDWCDAPCIEKGLVRGLAAVAEGNDRCGELIVQDEGGKEHAFNITATHCEYPIPDDTYTLICTDNWGFQYWVVGRRLSGKRFEKVSLLEIPDGDERSRLEDLHITEECRNILV